MSPRPFSLERLEEVRRDRLSHKETNNELVLLEEVLVEALFGWRSLPAWLCH